MTPPLLPVIYAVYAITAFFLTVWLARTLFKNGAIFLEEVFAEPRLAAAVNRLLVVGFYLVNLGWALMMLRAGRPEDATRAIEILAEKLGTLLLVLAGVHFANLYIFHRIRRRGRLADALPPVAHTTTLPVT